MVAVLTADLATHLVQNCLSGGCVNLTQISRIIAGNGSRAASVPLPGRKTHMMRLSRFRVQVGARLI